MSRVFSFEDFPGLEFGANARHCEAIRLSSFSEWNYLCTSFPVTRLAKEGFYSTRTDDEIQCNFCRVSERLGNVLEGFFDFHPKHLDDCPLLTPDNNNVPLPTLKNSQQEQPRIEGDQSIHDISNVFRLTVRSHPPIVPPEPLRAHEGRYPAYATLPRRLNSFRDFPHTSGLSVNVLAQLGFFSMGVGDHVICFACGVRFHSWKKGDDPAVAHARWKPYCFHLLLVKGEAFVSRVQNHLLYFGA